MVDRIPAPVVLVGQPFAKTVDVTAATLKRQVTEHVVEGAILQHQDDDVVDLLKVGRTGLLHHDTSRGPQLPKRGTHAGMSPRVCWKPGCLRLQNRAVRGVTPTTDTSELRHGAPHPAPVSAS